MRVAILSQYPRSYSTSRLREACKERNARVQILETSNFLLQVRAGEPEIRYNGAQLPQVDALIPRIGSASVFGGCSVVRHFEQMGVFTVQSARGIGTAHDKFRTMQELSRHNIPIPPTVFVFNPTEVESAIEFLGGTPVVIKFLQGTQGSGVMLAEDVNAATSIVQALQVTHHRVLLQKFISESSGCDIRAFVVGGQVVAAMRRRAKPGEFRSNVHLGASVERVILDDIESEVALQSSQILGLGVAGVDILESKDGPLVIEVNASPGLEGIEAATNVDVASEIIEYIEMARGLNPIDLHERLLVGTDFQCIEVTIAPKTVRATNSRVRRLAIHPDSDELLTVEALLLKYQDVIILGVRREGRNIPSPDADFQLETGDELVLFGHRSRLAEVVDPKKSS
jgi:ribosomal protein S6--L-glutamate ligase